MINGKIKKYNPNKYLLPEAVIRVENYTKVIVNHFNSVIKNEFKNEKITMHNFCDRINPYFTKYNIVFSYSMLRPQDLLRPDMQDGIVSMETGSKSFQIKINICLNALNIFKQDGFLDKIFLPSFKLLLNHELVHRIQFIKNKSKYIQQVKSVYDNFITYDELMTYACQTVEEFRFAGIFDNVILQEIKKTIPEEDTVSSTFNFFNSKEIRLQFPKQYKQYLKYIYEYIKGNINKNNYSFIENVHQSKFKEIYRKNVKGLYAKI